MTSFHAGALDLKTLLVEGSKDAWYLTQTCNGFEDTLALKEQSESIADTDLLPEDDFVMGVLSYMVVQQRSAAVDYGEGND